MRIPWRRLAWVLAVVIPLAVIGGLIWGATRDLSRYQARLTEQIRKVTGRELAARVPLSVKLGRYPAMVAEGVTLTNAPWGSRPELARVRKLTLFLDPVALLLGEIKIGRLVLEGADILVERNEIGDSNLDMLPPPDGSGPHPGENRSLRLRTSPAFPWIGVIELQNSVLTVAVPSADSVGARSGSSGMTRSAHCSSRTTCRSCCPSSLAADALSSATGSVLHPASATSPAVATTAARRRRREDRGMSALPSSI